MDYRKIHDAIIIRAKNRVLSGYIERHHIIPKCMGGSNDKDNLVNLTAREHYVIHQLLIKIFPQNKKLIYAAVRMAKQCTGSRPYEWLRKLRSAAVSERMRGNNFLIGRKRPQHEKDKISKTMKGIPKSEVTKVKMSEAQKGNKKALGLVRGPMPQAQRDKISKTKKKGAADMDTKNGNPKDAVGIKKASMSTVSGPVLMELGVAMMEGARKYGRHNYRVAGVRASVYYDASMRHLMSWWEGEDLDPDSGLSHITKAIATLVVLRDSMIQERMSDDRPPKSVEFWLNGLNKKAADVIEKYPNPLEACCENNKKS